jgi:uncharacterized membrane protein YdbT with pleckstrin-like domain
MGRYIERSLSPGEAVRYTARLSLWNFSGYFLAAGVLVLACLYVLIRLPATTPDYRTAMAYFAGLLALLTLLCWGWPLLARSSTELAITDHRLIAKYGLLSTHSIEIRYSKIETVRVTQGIIGRLFSYGDIIVTGTGSTFDPIQGIADPLAFRTALGEAMEGASHDKSGAAP